MDSTRALKMSSCPSQHADRISTVRGRNIQHPIKKERLESPSADIISGPTLLQPHGISATCSSARCVVGDSFLCPPS